MNEKKYLKAVRRRLDLPRELKDRVISDLSSSIQERREAGQTEEEIFTALGSPKLCAADLNAQMREYTYRRSPWRFLFLAAAVAAGLRIGYELVLWVVVHIWVKLYNLVAFDSQAAVVGIIGGADGPTSIFITTPDWVPLALTVLGLAVCIFGYVRLCRCKRK